MLVVLVSCLLRIQHYSRVWVSGAKCDYVVVKLYTHMYVASRNYSNMLSFALKVLTLTNFLKNTTLSGLNHRDKAFKASYRAIKVAQQIKALAT